MKRPFFLLILLVVACTPTVAQDQPSPTALPSASHTAVSTIPPTSATTPLPPTKTNTPSPTITPSPEPTPTQVAAVPLQFEYIWLTLDRAMATTLYPSLSENGELVLHFAEDGYCVIQGCIKFTQTEALPEVLAEMMAEVETAVTTQDSRYEFKSRQIALILQSHTRLLSSTQLQGIRAVTFKTQNLPFISNNALTYEYRGITADGSYFVQAWIPVSLPFLPDSSDPGQENQPHFAVPLPELSSGREEELFPILEAYNEEIAAVVQQATDDTFVPDLATIDALIQSITLAAPENE